MLVFLVLLISLFESQTKLKIKLPKLLMYDNNIVCFKYVSCFIGSTLTNSKITKSIFDQFKRRTIFNSLGLFIVIGFFFIVKNNLIG